MAIVAIIPLLFFVTLLRSTHDLHCLVVGRSKGIFVVINIIIFGEGFILTNRIRFTLILTLTLIVIFTFVVLVCEQSGPELFMRLACLRRQEQELE